MHIRMQPKLPCKCNKLHLESHPVKNAFKHKTTIDPLGSFNLKSIEDDFFQIAIM